MSRYLLGKLARGRFFRRRYSKHTVASGKLDRNFISLAKKPIRDPAYPIPKYGGINLVTLIVGDSYKKMGDYIEVIFDHMNVPIMFEKIFSKDHLHKKDDERGDFCEITVGIKRNRVALRYDIYNDKETRAITRMLDLYAEVVNVTSFPIETSKSCNMDLLFILQNNMGDYEKMEYEPVKGVVETLSIATLENIQRFLNYAFKYAEDNCRKNITFAHKLLELPLRDGLFLRTARDMCAQFPDITFNMMEIGSLSQRLVRNPNQFDVICVSELYGNPLVAIACGMCGGSGVISASNFGDYCSIYQPIVGQLSLPDAEVNPFGPIMSAIHLLTHLGHNRFAKKLWNSLIDTTFCKKIMTKDIGGSASLEEVICNIIKNL